MNRLLPFGIILTLVGLGIFAAISYNSNPNPINIFLENPTSENQGGPAQSKLHPLTIEALRSENFPGSDLVIEQTLEPGNNYQRYIASYKSEGLKIYGLLTIPNAEKPASGFPTIIFNHGYVPPAQYRTTERYIAYTDGFSRNGYILFRPDYRGHGNSEGVAAGGYGSNAYTIDVLNALESVKKLTTSSLRGDSTDEAISLVDADRIGMWGHSMGGFITLRSMVVSKDIKAGVIWGGVVASFPDLLNNWRRRNSPPPGASPTPGSRGWRTQLVQEFGEPEKNPEFWNSISANSYLKDIAGPIQLHHGEADSSVPVQFSRTLNEQIKEAGKESEVFAYPGDDHDITANFGIAIQRSIEFFDKHVKGQK